MRMISDLHGMFVKLRVMKCKRNLKSIGGLVLESGKTSIENNFMMSFEEE
jgi:hypothetical protein